MVGVMVSGSVFSHYFLGRLGQQGLGREPASHCYCWRGSESIPNLLCCDPSFGHERAACQSLLGVAGGLRSQKSPLGLFNWTLRLGGKWRSWTRPLLLTCSLFPSCFSFFCKDWVGKPTAGSQATERLRMNCWQGALLEIKFCPILCTILVSHIRE